MTTHLFRGATLLLLLLLTGIFPGRAQIFIPPSAYEFVYNGTHANWATSKDISCFSFQNLYSQTAWGKVDVYLATRGFGFSEVTIQFTAPGDPTNVLYQKTLNYDDGSYFQVGAVYNEDAGTVQILVAHQWFGFKVDVYDITNSPTDPIVYNNTITLVPAILFVNSFDNNRIRMDSNSPDLRKVAIVWDNPYVGLQAIGCENGLWGNVVNIDNTTGEAGPDVAFTQDYTGFTKIHLVHHDASGTAITTSSMPFSYLMTTSNIVYPNIDDINYLSSPLQSNLVLDCPDLTDEDAWAYTYTDQNNQKVFVRTGYLGTINTITANDGTLGNASTLGQYNVYSPSLHYGKNYAALDNNIVVGWYNTDGAYNGYIALKMSTDPLAPWLVSDPDYLELPNAMTPGTAYPIIPSYDQPGIAFSKGDVEFATRHLYAVYSDIDHATGNRQLHHAFHDWGLTTFKKKVKLETNSAEVYPNPFSDVLHTSVNLQQAGTIRLELIDISGRVVAQEKMKAEKGNQSMQLRGLQHIHAGTYFLSTIVDGNKVNTRPVVKQ